MAVAQGHAASRGWRLNEVASAGRENLDPDYVALYDEKSDAKRPRRWTSLWRSAWTNGQRLSISVLGRVSSRLLSRQGALVLWPSTSRR